MLDKEVLKREFAALGIHAGMHIMVHSSLKSFGHVEGGADAIIDALMELLTPEGTLMMPSFNHEACYNKGEIFSMAETPTINGLIPETFRKRPGVLRSVNPTHSFAAWGKNAEKYTAHHQEVPAMGVGSPLDLLKKDGGYCVLLGVPYRSNTFHHHVETVTGAHCLGDDWEEYPMKLMDGTEVKARTWAWRSARCEIDDTASYAPEMEKIHTQRKIGEATVTMYRLQEGFEIIAKCLKEGYAGHPPCSECPIMPRICKWTNKK